MTDSERAQVKSRLRQGWYRACAPSSVEAEVEGLLAEVLRLERENERLTEALESYTGQRRARLEGETW